MKNFKNIYGLYQKLMNKSLLTFEDQKFLKKFNKSYEMLEQYQKVIFKRTFLQNKNKDWWKSHYSLQVYIRLKESTVNNFITIFNKL